ncbi:conjugal transfer protein TraG N-terminal domain-containing protein [Vibrio sp. 10N.261.46.A3]|uniref:conjugal transfer protein TraG N-terminal domain-containing protein n=1 Tax=Vibrio sp. 10N.261.46.A3 TaxID=3229658 RepID=UPI00354BBABC
MIMQDLLSLTLLSQAWYLSNQFWYFLNVSGIVVFLFFVIVIDQWITATEEGADEGNKASLAMNRTVTRLTMAGLVLIFATMPTVPISMQTLTFNESLSQQCGVSISSGHSEKNQTLVDGKPIYTPILWGLVHSLAQGINTGMTASIPCEGDITRTMLQLDDANITSPVLKQEVQMFYEQCYTRAKVALNTLARIGEATEEDFVDAHWIAGRTFFKPRPQMPGASYTTIQSDKPVYDFPYKSERDDPKQTSRYNDKINTRKTYPMCDEWWETTEKDPRVPTKPAGLKYRLYVDLANNYPGVTEDLVKKRGVFERLLRGDSTPEERLDMYLERVLSPSNQKHKGAVSHGYGQRIDNNLGSAAIGAWNFTAGSTGAIIGHALSGPVFFVVREALPMIQAMLLMVVVVSAPIVTVISLYRINVVASLLVTYFGLVTLTMWWEIARFLETHLMEILYTANQNYNPITMVNNTMDDIILGMALMFFYVAVSSVWLGLLGYAGYKTSAVNIESFASGIQKTTQQGQDLALGALQKSQQEKK